MVKCICRTVILVWFLILSKVVSAAPPPPALVVPVGANNVGNITFQWLEAPQATWYRVSAWDESGNTFRKWVKADGNCSGICSYASTYQAQGLAQWHVKSFDGTDIGVWSDTEKFWDVLPAPAVPTLLEGSMILGDSNTGLFAWSTSGVETWYKLQIRDNISGDSIFDSWLRVGNAQGLSCDIECDFITFNLPFYPGPQFEGRVRSYNGVSLSSWSNWLIGDVGDLDVDG